MRTQKIRGFNRRFRDIEKWRLKNLELPIDLIQKYNGDHIDIVVHPWCDISIINSKIPEPKGKVKKLMINGLIDIYISWKKQLDKLGIPYYLKIWLFEPRFSKSQIVCSIDDRINFYNNTFFKPDIPKEFIPSQYGQLAERLYKFEWDYRLDEDHYENTFVGEPELYASSQDYEESIIWFNKLLKKPHRLIKFSEPIGEATELYSFPKGCVWIGGLK